MTGRMEEFLVAVGMGIGTTMIIVGSVMLIAWMF